MVHVREIGLKRGSDSAIWEWAKTNDHTIITTDADFVALNVSRGWPPKVIHLEECDFPLRVIEDLLRQNAVRISEFMRDRGAPIFRPLAEFGAAAAKWTYLCSTA